MPSFHKRSLDSRFLLCVVCLIAGFAWKADPARAEEGVAVDDPRFRVLVFSGTAGYRHASIPDGIAAIERLGREHDFGVAATEETEVFTSDSLDAFEVVVFLNTSGDVLNPAQQIAFEAYIHGGGNFVGIHGAAATEYDWTWYGRLVGAFFADHPEPQEAIVHVLEGVHPSTQTLPARWERFDEWYNFRTNPRGTVHVLAVLHEGSYDGGTMGHDHPIAWAHEVDGGRAWYTGLGHTSESYSEPAFLAHVLGGIEWAAGAAEGDAGATVTSHFEKVVLMPEVTDPMELAVDSRGRVFLAERSGAIKLWDPETGATRTVGFVPVRMTIEDGLLGLTLDPQFDENGWAYVYYSPADGGPQRLARWTFDGTRLDPATERILLEIPSQQEECCHSGGSLAFGPDGTLYLSTGDNTNPYPLGGSAIDERPGFRVGDAQRTSANTNDLRGKILRIRPLPDGSYEIPEGNLFEGDSLHRPEIYTMGHRNPYRISVDPATGWLYWGDVGIGNAPSEARGPWGWEEFNQALEPGFYGWPYIVGPNDPYRDFDYDTETPGPFFDPEAPVNDSPNNTGARQLPPAQPAMIWYTYGGSEEFPEMGEGAMSAMAGPVYRYDPASASAHALPEYYDGSLLIYEWMRHWVQEVKFDEEGDLLEINPFLPGLDFVRPTDIEMGPDGRLYVAEWGEAFWGSNHDAQVVRIDYRPTASGESIASLPPASRSSGSGATVPQSSARTPAAQMAASSAAGQAQLHFSWPPEGGIFDYDEPVFYQVKAMGNVEVEVFSGHDTHVHSLGKANGAGGRVTVTREFTHVPDLHYMDRFAVLEARDAEGNVGRVVLRPRVVEAEHAAQTELAERHTFGKHPAEPDFARGALTVMNLESGGYVRYEPLSLAGIDTMVVRLKPVPGGRLEIRTDDLDGPVLARLTVDADTGRPVPSASPGQPPGTVLPQDVITDLPEGVQAAYHGWRELRIPIPDHLSSSTLILSVENASTEGVVLRVDRLEFIGNGTGALDD